MGRAMYPFTPPIGAPDCGKRQWQVRPRCEAAKILGMNKDLDPTRPRGWRRLALLSSLFAACGSPASDSDVDSAPPSPVEVSSDPCLRITGAPALSSDRSEFAQLSTAHATIRLFGHSGPASEIDTALLEAIGEEPTWSVGDALPKYASALNDVCLVQPTDAGLGDVQTRSEGAVLWVVPGRGELVVDEAVQTLVVDLRNLPETPDTAGAIARAIAAGLDTPLARTRPTVRQLEGYPDDLIVEDWDDEAYGMTYEEFVEEYGLVYTSELASVELEPLAAGGRARNLVLVTGARMAPSAAQLAGDLRLAGRAWLVGHDVLAAVAESSVVPAAGQALSFRSRDLADWPDVISADIRTDQPEQAVPDLAPGAMPPSLEREAPTRAPFAPHDAGSDQHSPERSLGQVRAAVMIAHGVLGRAYPYIESVRDALDARLEEVLDQVDERRDEPAETLTVWALRRLTHALDDGFTHVRDLLTQGPLESRLSRTIPVVFDVLDDGSVVVAHSDTAGLSRGDRLLSRNGQILDSFLEAESTLSSGGTALAEVLSRASDWLLTDETTVEVERLAPDGSMDTVEVATVPIAEWQVQVRAAGGRSPRGGETRFLEAEGAPDVFYINLARSSAAADPDKSVLTQFDEAQAGARAMILDARGGISVEASSIMYYLREEPMLSPQWWVGRWTGPEQRVASMEQWNTFAIVFDFYDGPIAVLTGPENGGSDETFIGVLTGAERAQTVGRTTRGSNGNITALELPGRFSVGFRPMEVRNVDGSEFHNVGYGPDRAVARTLDTLLAGEDPDLAAALELLSAGE